ncbi:MAG TPA: hypothetical protein VFL31_00445 [Nitrospiraceae bacterium]|nr:hypothetical protein [Nitrospiraceae bacterium]
MSWTVRKGLGVPGSSLLFIVLSTLVQSDPVGLIADGGVVELMMVKGSSLRNNRVRFRKSHHKAQYARSAR